MSSINRPGTPFAFSKATFTQVTTQQENPLGGSGMSDTPERVQRRLMFEDEMECDLSISTCEDECLMEEFLPPPPPPLDSRRHPKFWMPADATHEVSFISSARQTQLQEIPFNVDDADWTLAKLNANTDQRDTPAKPEREADHNTIDDVSIVGDPELSAHKVPSMAHIDVANFDREVDVSFNTENAGSTPARHTTHRSKHFRGAERPACGYVVNDLESTERVETVELSFDSQHAGSTPAAKIRPTGIQCRGKVSQKYEMEDEDDEDAEAPWPECLWLNAGNTPGTKIARSRVRVRADGEGVEESWLERLTLNAGNTPATKVETSRVRAAFTDEDDNKAASGAVLLPDYHKLNAGHTPSANISRARTRVRAPPADEDDDDASGASSYSDCVKLNAGNTPATKCTKARVRRF